MQNDINPQQQNSVMAGNYHHMVGPAPAGNDNRLPASNAAAENKNPTGNAGKSDHTITKKTVSASPLPSGDDLTGRGQVIAVPKQELTLGGNQALVPQQNATQVPAGYGEAQPGRGAYSVGKVGSEDKPDEYASVDRSNTSRASGLNTAPVSGDMALSRQKTPPHLPTTHNAYHHNSQQIMSQIQSGKLPVKVAKYLSRNQLRQHQSKSRTMNSAQLRQNDFGQGNNSGTAQINWNYDYAKTPEPTGKKEAPTWPRTSTPYSASGPWLNQPKLSPQQTLEVYEHHQQAPKYVDRYGKVIGVVNQQEPGRDEINVAEGDEEGARADWTRRQEGAPHENRAETSTINPHETPTLQSPTKNEQLALGTRKQSAQSGVTGQAGTGTTSSRGAQRAPLHSNGPRVSHPERPREFSNFSQESCQRHNTLLKSQIEKLPTINSSASRPDAQDLPMLTNSLSRGHSQMSGNADRPEQNRSPDAQWIYARRQLSLEQTRSASQEDTNLQHNRAYQDGGQYQFNYNWEQPLPTRLSPMARAQQHSITNERGIQQPIQQVEYRGQVPHGEADFSLRVLDGRQASTQPQRQPIGGQQLTIAIGPQERRVQRIEQEVVRHAGQGAAPHDQARIRPQAADSSGPRQRLTAHRNEDKLKDEHILDQNDYGLSDRQEDAFVLNKTISQDEARKRSQQGIIDRNKANSTGSAGDQEQTPLFAKALDSTQNNQQTAVGRDQRPHLKKPIEEKNIRYSQLTKMIRDLGRQQNKSLRRIQAQMSEERLEESVATPEMQAQDAEEKEMIEKIKLQLEDLLQGDDKAGKVEGTAGSAKKTKKPTTDKSTIKKGGTKEKRLTSKETISSHSLGTSSERSLLKEGRAVMKPVAAEIVPAEAVEKSKRQQKPDASRDQQPDAKRREMTFNQAEGSIEDEEKSPGLPATRAKEHGRENVIETQVVQQTTKEEVEEVLSQLNTSKGRASKGNKGETGQGSKSGAKNEKEEDNESAAANKPTTQSKPTQHKTLSQKELNNVNIELHEDLRQLFQERQLSFQAQSVGRQSLLDADKKIVLKIAPKPQEQPTLNTIDTADLERRQGAVEVVIEQVSNTDLQISSPLKSSEHQIRDINIGVMQMEIIGSSTGLGQNASANQARPSDVEKENVIKVQNNPLEIIFHERMPEFSIKMPGDKEGTIQKVKIKKPTQGKNKRTIFKLTDVQDKNRLVSGSSNEFNKDDSTSQTQSISDFIPQTASGNKDQIDRVLKAQMEKQKSQQVPLTKQGFNLNLAPTIQNDHSKHSLGSFQGTTRNKSLTKEVVNFNCKRKGNVAFKLGKAIEKLYHKEIMDEKLNKASHSRMTLSSNNTSSQVFDTSSFQRNKPRKLYQGSKDSASSQSPNKNNGNDPELQKSYTPLFKRQQDNDGQQQLQIDEEAEENEEPSRKMKYNYYIPMQASQNRNYKLDKNKKMQGLLKVNWKKGLSALNINNDCEEHSQNSSSEQSNQGSRGICKTKKQGGGRFQTYANFLQGEEKEQYEKFLENRRVLLMKRTQTKQQKEKEEEEARLEFQNNLKQKFL